MATDMSKVKFKIIIFTLVMLMLIVPHNVFANDEDNVMLGDINGDKNIDSSDLLLLLRHVYASEINKHTEWVLTGNKFSAGDITQNGKIDSSDTIAILRYFAATGNKEIAKKHSKWLNLEEFKYKQDIDVEAIELDKTEVDLVIGNTATLKAKITPSDATNKSVTWTSSDDKVAEVNNGTVTAKGIGSATITAKTVNGKTASCTVNVKSVEILPQSVQLDKATLELDVGKTGKLVATIEPTNATNQEVLWRSSNEKVATVNKGTVTAKGEGKATITVETINGKTATCIVNVKPANIEVKNIKLNKTSIDMETGNTEKLEVTIEPTNATNKNVTWTTSSDKVATVNDGTVTAKGEGEATITAKTENGKTATCKVTVVKKTSGGKIVLKDTNVIDTSIPVYIGYKYKSLSQSQKKQIAYLAYLEQGSLEGAKIELSLMANLTEQNRTNHDVYDYVMNSGWFGPANCGEIPDNPQYDGYFTSKYYDAVESILVNGERYLTANVNEHDCISDISYISTGDKNTKSNYIPGKTVIHNVYGSVYTFVGFAPNGGDPFGYTD